RDLSGNVLADNASVNSGSEIWFVLYVDNPTDGPAFDIELLDQINQAQFTYIDGTLATTIVPAGSSDAAIWSGTWTPLSDNPDGDIGSVVDANPVDGQRDRMTIGTDTTQPNGQLDITTGTLQAFRFRVRVN
ncbi:MAG: hypothetical protein C0623_04820, partial [Desulfuromonas sp.]